MAIRPFSAFLLTAACIGVALAPSRAVEFEKGKVSGSFDTTVSVGANWRLDDPDPAIVGLDNGGQAFSVNGDSGNLNYATGVYSLTPKITAELELFFGERFGTFIRGSSFYDIENEDGDRERTPLNSRALKRVGSRTDLLDAFAWAKFDVGGKPAEFRIGEQVISWGESTFIQNGINAINPIEVSALRVPGAELREALLPEGLAWLNLTLSQNVSLELVYQYSWDDTEIDPPESYFSTNDFAGDGGEYVFLGFGSFGDTPPFFNPLDPLNPANPGTRPFLGVPRASDVTPENGGQYGAAFRWFVPELNQTEFGFYYLNYHSRLPTINAIKGSLAGAINASGVGAATQAALTELASSGDTLAAINAGIMAGSGVPGATAETVALVTGSTPAIVGTAAAGGDGAGLGGAIAIDAYAQTARYFLAYPEDIELFGASFNTQLGTSGVALQGEASYRKDAPLQVDDVELLFATLTPINPSLAAGSEGASQLAAFRGEDYSVPDQAVIPGFILRDVVQYQTTATKIFGHTFGASQALLLGEVALTHVQDMPDKADLRLEGPGTYTSGNPWHATPAGVPTDRPLHVDKPAETPDHFADASSWGYRVVGRLDYDNAIGAVRLSPRVSFQHDVNGVSPGPGGNFIEDRKAITVAVAAAYQNAWSADLGYTRYYGAGRHNLINDRDFIGVNVKYSF